MQTQFHLLRTRRFLPLFITQLLEAFNDNVFKNAMVILITYRLAQTAQSEGLMVTLAAGIFILPFFLFSALGGQLADKFDKTIITRIIKLIEVACMIIGSIGFYTSSIPLLFLTLFLMGTHSAFFGPIKYSILPNLLPTNELIAGNALVEASTFIAILIGTMVGSLFITTQHGIALISVIVITAALIGWASSFLIPRIQPAAPQLKINVNFLVETWLIVKQTYRYRDVYLSIMGISWFWLFGAVFLSQLPIFTKNVLRADASVVTLLLSMFSIGIAVGSLFCNRLLKGKITATYVPLGILGMTIFTFDLCYTSSLFSAYNNIELTGVGGFLTSWQSLRVLVDLFLMAFCGGIYIVPLYAIMQTHSPDAERSRVVACNNILNSLFMVAAAISIMLMTLFSFTVPEVFFTVGLINALVALYICKLLPEAVVKSFVKWLLKLCYRVEVHGLEQYDKAQGNTIVIANHTSYLDVILLSAFLPDTLTFAINTHMAKKWWLKPFLALAEVFPIDPTNPMATKSMIKVVKEGKKCVIFPEGRLTVTGALMKVYEGPVMIADKANAVFIPVRIDGTLYTPFSKLREKARTRWFPKIVLTILPPKKFNVAENVCGQERRALLGQQLYTMMTELLFESSDYHQTLFTSLLNARKNQGGRYAIVEGIERIPLGYNQFIMRCYILGQQLAKQTQLKEYVGLLLPTSVNAVITFFALQAYGRIPAMLNYSSGASNILHACRIAKIQQVYTARMFIEMAKLTEVVEQLTAQGVRVIYLEDLKQKITNWHKLLGFIYSQFAGIVHKKINHTSSAKDPAVVLFTSGSEGVPKGVVLSHENIQANRYQLGSCADFTARDIVFNALPIFHSFGLTAGVMLPLLSGIKTFFYPSPLHYRIIPELIYDTNATVLFGTDTFLSAYGRYAHPYDFYSLRYVFAGAEKLKEQTAQLWMQKFGIRIFEGYGATETSPALSMNTPMRYCAGSVGCLLPGIKYRLETIAGIAEGGRLFVSGLNIMMGYLQSEQPGVVVPAVEGWYDTGDIVKIDQEGYLTILGRAKRFAKIAGEMVSLTAVETYINQLWPHYHHAIISVADAKKGEQLILLTDDPTAKREELIAYYQQNGISELALPKKIFCVTTVPLLLSGKVDYPQAQKQVENLIKNDGQSENNP